ncbi:Nucleolar transcription factor 1-B [Halotydeus destructor]|nr:Nucleolar transcription factor 1-B [Halotydeus destructor]
MANKAGKGKRKLKQDPVETVEVEVETPKKVAKKGKKHKPDHGDEPESSQTMALNNRTPKSDKKKKNKGSQESSLESQESDASPVAPKRAKTGPKKKKPAEEEWATEDLNSLVTRLDEVSPEYEKTHFATAINKVDWNEIAFGQYSGDECKEKWTSITSNLRKFRNLGEMVKDAKEWAKQPWTHFSSIAKKPTRHPDMPRKPLTPFFIFFIEKRQQIADENPGMNVTQLAKVASQKFQKLSDKKKEKYKKQYDDNLEVYRANMGEFRAAHPELNLKFNKSSKRSEEGLDKPKSGFELFKAERLPKEIDAGHPRDVALKRVKEAFDNLSEGKRIKWIRKAVADEARYLGELEEFMSGHPEHSQPKFRSVVSKKDIKLKDRYDGKPDQPPNNGYALFAKEELPKVTGCPQKEKMVMISKKWKGLTDDQREEYKNRSIVLMAKYADKLEAYLSKLSPAERERVLMDDKMKFISTEQIQHLASKNLVPLSRISKEAKCVQKAQQLYAKEKMAEVQKKGYDVMDYVDAINEEWDSLSLKLRGPYLRKAYAELHPQKEEVEKVVETTVDEEEEIDDEVVEEEEEDDGDEDSD